MTQDPDNYKEMAHEKEMNEMTIDIEPDWLDIAPMLIEWIKDGTDNQYQLAVEGIMQMAKACSQLRREQKEQEE